LANVRRPLEGSPSRTQLTVGSGISDWWMVGLRANDRKAEEALLRRDGCVDGVSEVVVDATEAPDPMLQVTAIDRSTHIVCVIDDRSG
jgi:hypothetical protein